METTIKYLIDPDVDELCFRMECAVRNLGAVHEAMERGSDTMESYTPAIFASYLFLYDLASELRQMVEDAQGINVPVTKVSE